MTDAQEISDSECLLRWVKPKFVHPNEKVGAQAFVLRPADEGTGLSVNRPSVFKGDCQARYRAVNNHIQLKVTARSRYAYFQSVARLRKLLVEEEVYPKFVPHELPARESWKADPSHALIVDLPKPSVSDEDEKRATRIGELLASEASIHKPPSST